MSEQDENTQVQSGLAVKKAITVTLVALCGLYAMWEGLELDLGSVRRIGAGAFPFAIGLLLVIMSAFLIFAEKENTSVEQVSLTFRGPSYIAAAMISFMVLITPLGLAPTVAIVTILSASADRSLRLRSVLLLALFSSLLCTLVFVVLLDLPLKPFWW